jgi:uncharacterized protein (UPF0262 family)|tara:strand:+ start:1044 stop:1520 length:477 start_codon:yes stop_codon:yes gene_type:complete
MPDQNKNYIKKINLNYKDGESIAEFISYERQAAIHDLINENSFSINEDDIGGPYVIEIEISDNVLIVKITNDNQSYSKDHRIPINSLKKTVKIYHSACNLYFDSIKKGSIDKIEEIEKNRRNIHNEGANKLLKITESNFTMDHNTSRRMFTLLYSLYI